MDEVLRPSKHVHGSPLRQEALRLPNRPRDREVVRLGWDLHYEELERYPVGSIIRCECGALIRFVSGDFGECWVRLSWWRRWRNRRELAERGI